MTASSAPSAPASNGLAILRAHAEQQFADELDALIRSDTRPRPPSWRMSPWAVATYLLGGRTDDGTEITPKYIGSRRLMEIAIATLATDRALLLLGVPGTAKTWVAEHLAAAISGDSTLLVQGTAGTSEESVRYGWNYARLLADGPSRAALVTSPIMRAMAEGRIARVEELTRIPADVQDALITILSEKSLPIPELGQEVQAVKGFNLIATANDRDKGVNELSSALKRRFNVVVLPVPATIDEEVDIVTRRVDALGRALELPAEAPAAEETRRGLRVMLARARRPASPLKSTPMRPTRPPSGPTKNGASIAREPTATIVPMRIRMAVPTVRSGPGGSS
jgi:MoxR-like ATPase